MTDRRWLEYVPLDGLRSAPRNARTHAQGAIGASVDRFGFVEPIVLDERTGMIVAGHGRRDQLTALRESGSVAPEGVTVDGDGGWLVPVVRGWGSLSDGDAEAAGVALNRSQELGGWDDAVLAEILNDLDEAGDPAVLVATGFTPDDLEGLLASLDSGPPAPDDESELPPSEWEPPPRLCQPGDVFELGSHRLIVGDCRDGETVRRLVDGRTIGLGFTSPPYADRRDYDNTTDFRPVAPSEYVDWFAPVAANVAEHLAADGSWVVNIRAGAVGLDKETYCLDLVLAHVREWGWHWAEEFCWARSGMPVRPARRLKNQFEPIYQFTRGEWKWRPERLLHASDNAIYKLDGVGETNWAAGQGVPGRNEGIAPKKRKRPARGSNASTQGTNVDPGEAVAPGFAYPGNRLPSFAGSHEATGHPAAFPRGLASWFITLLTDEADAVFDPFAGSGSTLMAAHESDRIGLACEISPAYCDVICRRFEEATGIVPLREGVPVSFLP